MFAYVKHIDGQLEIVKSERIHHLTVPINHLKKYKLTHENGLDTSDVIVVYLEDSLEELNNKIENNRLKVPPAKLLQSASDLSDYVHGDVQEKSSLKEKNDKTSLLAEKVRGLTELQKLSSSSDNLPGKGIQNIEQKESVHKILKSSSKSNEKGKKKRKSAIKLNEKENESGSRKKKKVEQRKKTLNIFATNKRAHNCTEVLNVDAKNNSQVQSTAHSTEDEIISSEQNDTDTALKCDTATPAEIEKISLQQLNTATSPVTDAIISSKVTVTVPNEKNSINNISGNNNNLVDEKIPDKQNVIPSTSCTSTVNSAAITDNFENGKETCNVQPEKSTSKSIPSKNIAKTGKKSSKEKKARKIEKNKLKVTERQLAEALETIKSYRNLVEKKQKELEHWQNLNAQLQSKVYEKLDEYATRDVNPFEQIAKGAANVGYLRESDNMIHCGNNVYISKNDYDNAKNKLYTYHKKNRKGSRYSGFVRYIAEVIFGYETLKKSSVTGRKSGRSKGEAKEKLDPKLMGAVIGIFRHYLAVDMKLDPVEVAQELKATGEHIASKIADMNRKSKKNEAIEGDTKETEQTGEGLLFVGLDDANKPDLIDKPDLTENKEKADESSSTSEDENSDVSGEETSTEDSESEDTDK